MPDLWAALLPLAIGSAVLPLQVAVTVLFLQVPTGRATAVAWVAGMTVVRLAQGLVFGLIFETGAAQAEGSARPGPIVSTLLVIVAIALLVSALRKLLTVPDDDDPPPKWMAMVESATPARAFLLGAGVVLVSAKLWAFTLATIGVIAEAALGRTEAIVTFLVFVVAAESIHIGAIAMAYLVPRRSAVLLTRASAALRRYDRAIMVALGLVFGVWFLAKGLQGLGVF